MQTSEQTFRPTRYRWSRAQYEQMIEAGVFDEDARGDPSTISTSTRPRRFSSWRPPVRFAVPSLPASPNGGAASTGVLDLVEVHLVLPSKT